MAALVYLSTAQLQVGKARTIIPILQVNKLRLQLPGHLSNHRTGVWTQVPAGGLWVT